MITSFIKDLTLIKDTWLGYMSRDDGIANTRYKIQKYLESKSVKPHKYAIHYDESLSVDIKESLYLNDENLDKIPMYFNHVEGDVELSHNKLTSLKGAPQKIDGSFFIYNNELKSLDYLPKYVGNIIVMDTVDEKEFQKLDKMEYFKEVRLLFEKNSPPPSYFIKKQYDTHIDSYKIKERSMLCITFDEFKSYMEKINLEKIIHVADEKKESKKLKI